MKKVKLNRFKLFLCCIAGLFSVMQIATVEAQNPGTELAFDVPLGEGEVFVIPVDGMIDKGLARYIERATTDAEEAGASLIIYHVDTFGGLVDAADMIRKRILNAEVPTLAYIDKNAASAGALISYSADRIVMAPGSSIGAATVVEGTGAKASEKYQSYMRGLMRATAEANGRDPAIAEAMVDDSLFVEGISEVGELLTLSAQEALNFDVADAIAENIDQIAETLDHAHVARVAHEASSTERLLRFLGSPILQSILMLMMMGGLYFELQSPGVGFAGLMAAVGASLFFAPHYMMGLVESWELVLFGIGVLLLLAEIFVIPGFGIAGGAGLLLVIGSLIAALIGNVGFDFPSGGAISSAIGTMAMTLVLLGVLIFSLARYLPTSNRFNKLVLQPELSSAEGYVAVEISASLVGKVGKALTPLRPAGTVEIEGDELPQRLDVVTAGEYVLPGAMVKIIDVRGSRIQVRPVATLSAGDIETSAV